MCDLWFSGKVSASRAGDPGIAPCRPTSGHTCGFNFFFLRGKFSLVSFRISSTLVCKFLLAAQFIETSTTKSVFLWYRSQRDVHLFCKFRMTFT